MIQTLSDALSERGYETMTAVQEEVTRPELQNADLLVSAQTGSGKTVAFGLAMAPTLLDGTEALGEAASPLALVIAPTRELAFQVMRELGWLYAKAGGRVVSCVGGMDMREERRALERGAHIVVGTPGRLRDHIQRGSLVMERLRVVVLDEADEMLDMGFREDLEFMLGLAPADRRTLMFSATVPAQIAKLAAQYQRDAVRVTTLSGTRQHADIAYQAVRVAPLDGENAIINLLRFHDVQNAIIFANTRAVVSRLSARLSNRGFSVVTLSGELSQKERTHALQAMRDGRARVCVATDVAARGIDLPNLELVIHAELPANAEGLLHRSGRTGRAGRKGTSVLIVPPKLVRKAENLLRIARIEAEWTVAPTADEILSRDEERLLADPVWTEEATEEQEAFAAKLLALHSPERIAAAYLRLYRSGQSAPEELGWADAPAEPKVKKEFGPSEWFALSVGRNDRAEARWLLPMLCRAGNFGKDAIGAIRVQPTETFVEIAKENAAGFLSALGEDAELAEGITIRRSDPPPERPPRPTNSSKTGPRKPRQTAGETVAPDAAPSRSEAPAGGEGSSSRSEADQAAFGQVSAPFSAEAPRQEPSRAPRPKHAGSAAETHGRKPHPAGAPKGGSGKQVRKAPWDEAAVTPAKTTGSTKRPKIGGGPALARSKGQKDGNGTSRRDRTGAGVPKASKR